MNLIKRTLVATLGATALAVSLVAASGGAGASAAELPGYRSSTKDAGDVKHRLDIRRVTVAADNVGEPAGLTVVAKSELGPNDAITVWFNLDRDRRPELRLDALAYSNFVVRRADGWGLKGRDVTSRGCLRPSVYGRTVSVEFAPACYAKDPQSFAIAVRMYNDVRGIADWAPGRRTWMGRISRTS